MKMVRKALSLILVLSLFVGVMPVFAVEGDAYMRELPVAENGLVAGSSGYLGNVNIYSESEAQAAGVPQGYSGYVVKVARSSAANANGAYPTCDFDFSSQNIPIDKVESITFRVYVHSGDRALRLKTPYTNMSWVMNCETLEKGTWTEVTLDVNGTNFQSGASMSSLANSEGNLGQLALICRLDGSKQDHFYVDAITVKYKAGMSDDITPPVISYSGEYAFEAKEGEVFFLDGVSAFDEYDNSSAVITYEWSEGAVNGLGILNVGTHTYTVKATDRSGNTSTLSVTVNVKANTSVIHLDSIPYTSYVEGVSNYDGTVTDLSADEALAKGVPSGYSGNVLMVSSNSARFGMTFDGRDLKIPIHLIEYITFRVYMNVSTNALRISDEGASDWAVLSNLTAGTWVDYTVKADGSGFSNNKNMENLDDENGNLGIFGIGTKYEAKDYVFYIDSISIKLKEDDGAAPVLSYSGEKDILTSAGKRFEPGISAYDEQEERKIALVYEWSEGALDAEGNMLEGSHTCRVSATDYYGNTSQINLTVTVGAPDVTPPEISFGASEIVVTVGTYYRMVITCVDNYDRVEVVEVWSDGAIDPVGRLAEGVHTLTLTATDLSGNVTVHVVTVRVLSGDSTVGTLVQCGK